MKTVRNLIISLCLLSPAGPGFAQTFPELTQAVQSGEFGSLKAVLIAQNGELLYEQYFRGTAPGDLHHVHSVTKSVGSALIGIAHRQGKVALDDNLLEYFLPYYPMQTAPYLDKRFITLEDVLMQRHGVNIDEWAVDYRDGDNPISAAVNSGDWYGYFLREPLEAEPGEKFRYSTLASNLMSRFIRLGTGENVQDYAEAELFGPLGISNVLWQYSGQDSAPEEWPNPDDDVPLGFALRLKPTDMLRFGEMYRRGGVHEGERILDQSWIEASWQSYSNAQNTGLFADNDGGYGYQWWKLVTTDNRDRTFEAHYADGWGRQHIIILPELNVTIVSVSDDYDYSGPGIGALMRTLILPQLNPALDNRYTGAWYDTATPGQGINLQVLGNGTSLVGFWYTYDADGNRRWFVMTGTISGDEAELSIIRTEGGKFLQPDPVEESEWGTARISTVDCDHMTLEVESSEVITSIPLTRLTGECSMFQ